jgi:8-oxo-dGTP pyrophosphatase MutT (NUDIX family)
MQTIRAKAVCIFRHKNKILLSEGYDPVKDEHYLIPIGGGIDFGEISEEAARREVLEEIGAEIRGLQLLGVLENLFTFDGKAGHEIVFVYEADFINESLYSKAEIQGIESDGAKFKVKWFDQKHLESGALKIYPHGIAGLL